MGEVWETNCASLAKKNNQTSYFFFLHCVYACILKYILRPQGSQAVQLWLSQLKKFLRLLIEF